MAEFGFDLSEVEQLIRLVEERGLARLEIEEEGRRLVIAGPRVRRQRHGETPGAHLVASPARPARRDAPVPAPAENLAAIESPMVGVFYRASSPDSAPLVEVGDHVEIGQPVGIIEAMKVFSEIPSEHAGVVAEIAVQNGALVRQGEPLMYLHKE